MPPLAEEDKNLIMHIELPILGGHILMGTDAPESMGFIVNYGNNVHIINCTLTYIIHPIQNIRHMAMA